MSKIYFHSKYNCAEVSGAERTYASLLCIDFFVLIMQRLSVYDFKAILPKDCYLIEFEEKEFKNNIRSWIVANCFNEHLFIPNNDKISLSSTILNTAIACGSNSIKLLARMHGQCEIHCFVRSENKKWLANIIKEGRNEDILRSGMGWEHIIELLIGEKNSAVVLSYSVTERFPYAGYVINEENEEECDKFDALSYLEKWDKAYTKLLEINEDRKVELSPNDWDSFRFGKGYNGFKIINIFKELRNDTTGS